MSEYDVERAADREIGILELQLEKTRERLAAAKRERDGAREVEAILLGRYCESHRQEVHGDYITAVRVPCDLCRAEVAEREAAGFREQAKALAEQLQRHHEVLKAFADSVPAGGSCWELRPFADAYQAARALLAEWPVKEKP